MNTSQSILCLLLSFAAPQALACYTVLDSTNQVVYQSQVAPVDMSRPIHETLPSRYPNGHLIFDVGAECPVISSVASGLGGRNTLSTAPMLTDRRTAEAMKLPYKVIEGNIALVNPRDAVLMPGISVMHSRNESVGRPATSMMGAGPSRGAVITELRDPPVTIEESGGRVILRNHSR